MRLTFNKSGFRVYTKIDDMHTAVHSFPWNPIKYIKQRIEKWHHDWAMARLQGKTCRKCGEPYINPNEPTL